MRSYGKMNVAHLATTTLKNGLSRNIGPFNE
nr:MAG TPA: hypothetical protein [Inoviridae sp.]